jgi:hypothetical protein
MPVETPLDPQAQAVAGAVTTAGMSDEDRAVRLKVETSVRRFFKEFEDDRTFDKPIRMQIQKDRRYASGEAQSNWAVSTNMIGSAIDTQVATLYARDPDVSVKPAPQVDPPPDPITGQVPPQPERQRNVDFAKSLELVLSALWKKGNLKPRMRRIIRSILSASHGWLKVLPLTDRVPDPLAQNEYNSLQTNVASAAAQITALQSGQTLDGQTASLDDLEVQKQELETSLEALSGRLEVDKCFGFTFDIVKPENLQVGTDVELLEEYLDSDSLTEIMYFPHDQLREKFPELKDEDLKAAEKYYRKTPVNANRGEMGNGGEGDMIASMFPNQGATDDLYSTNEGKEGARAFARVLEKWNKADNHIYTGISGVKVWARTPYKPSWGSSRWYPYFYFSLNEVDGQRCPQSMSARGAKLQDEYASVRSNLRITRRRSIPGTIVDATALSDEELKKVTDGVIAEFTPLRATQPNQDFGKMFAAKPVPNVDLRLYDTTPIIMDFERTFGLSDTQQQAKSIETTATEEEIKANSSNNRTSTWRDTLETTLSDMALYCAEVALQKIEPDIAQKIAGPAVYWPYGMSLEDLNSLVEVNITAGTTGKPKNSGDRDAWGIILPQLRELATQIFTLQQNPATAPLAAALAEQMRETMRRFGDESDLARFIPQMPTLPIAPPMGPPALSGDPGAPSPHVQEPLATEVGEPVQEAAPAESAEPPQYFGSP